MIKEITSTKNQTYKYIKSLKTKKARKLNGQFTVEGIKSVTDAINAGSNIAYIAVSDKLADMPDFDTIYRIPDNIFAPLCDTDSPQGILAVINIPKKFDANPTKPLYLYCDRVSDPGNLGTIIRICDAADCGLLLSDGCADIYNPKTVRASMGSFFHTDITENVSPADILRFKQQGYTFTASALSGKTEDYSTISGNKLIIAVGNEANGICDEVLSLADKCVKIPIWGRAESLNVGVAAALLLYEAKRNASTENI